ncbi:MAG: Asp-tRNA(Asn)/Glu-tRNA(Gln) amidotransferase subunit GatC [Ruminococcus sp.]|nr:Asp-tRNA(Asn)/Glu-tRNA(Gln) amidotransferase subunit GatC [Ruminococcus sp.]
MVTREDVENIALLSKLFVPEEELDGLTESMQKIVDFADAINNAPASDEDFDNINNLSNMFREDEVVPSFPAEEILKNAPEQAEQHFLVRNRE